MISFQLLTCHIRLYVSYVEGINLCSNFVLLSFTEAVLGSSCVQSLLSLPMYSNLPISHCCFAMQYSINYFRFGNFVEFYYVGYFIKFRAKMSENASRTAERRMRTAIQVIRTATNQMRASTKASM